MDSDSSDSLVQIIEALGTSQHLVSCDIKSIIVPP